MLDQRGIPPILNFKISLLTQPGKNCFSFRTIKHIKNANTGVGGTLHHRILSRCQTRAFFFCRQLEPLKMRGGRFAGTTSGWCCAICPSCCSSWRYCPPGKLPHVIILFTMSAYFLLFSWVLLGLVCIGRPKWLSPMKVFFFFWSQKEIISQGIGKILSHCTTPPSCSGLGNIILFFRWLEGTIYPEVPDDDY